MVGWLISARRRAWTAQRNEYFRILCCNATREMLSVSAVCETLPLCCASA
jgi:hypothetical protein